MLKASNQHKFSEGQGFLLASVLDFEQQIAVVVRIRYDIVILRGKELSRDSE